MMDTLIREFIEGASLRDIVECRLAYRDIAEPFIYLRLRDGRELRLACSEDEAQRDLALVKGWIARPETFPAPPPPLSAAAVIRLFWAAFALLLVSAAWEGARTYWLVLGWAFTRHFVAGMFLSAAAFTAFWLTVSENPLRVRDYFLAAPLLLLMTAAFTSAGKSLNAALGSQTAVETRGRVVGMEDASFTAYFSRGKARGLNPVRISRWHIVVQDERTGISRRVEVPGWFADREKLTLGSTWEDRWYRGGLGWEYRKGRVGAGWDGLDFVPRVSQ